MKITQNVAFWFWNFCISTNFRPIKNDLSVNTVWLQASGFQNVTFLILAFSNNFCLKTELSGNTDRTLDSSLKKWTIFCILMNFCQLKSLTKLASLAILNETFSVIFKHRVAYCAKLLAIFAIVGVSAHHTENYNHYLSI